MQNEFVVYWRDLLRGKLTPFYLSTGRECDSGPTVWRTESLALDAAVQKKLSKATSGKRAERFALIVAAWSLVLRQIAGQAVILNLANPVQFGAMRVPLFCDPDAALGVQDWVGSVFAQIEKAKAHSGDGGRQLYGLLRTDEALSNCLVFGSSEAGSDLVLDPEDELALEVIDNDFDASVVGLKIHFMPDLFPENAISAVVEMLRYSVEAILDADTPVAQFDCARAGEHAGNIHDPIEAGPDETLIDAIGKWVQLSPTHPAVRDGAEQLDYQTLWSRAGEIAAQLNVSGQVIAILAPKSCETVAAVLGIMRSGNAFCALDHEQPMPAVLDALERLGISHLITYSDYTLELVGFQGTVAYLDVPQPGLPSPHEAPLSKDLAYVVMTSGSTGQPRGVAVSHSAVMSFVLWKNREYGFDQTTVTLQLAPFAFDSAISDLFCTMVAGGTLGLVGATARRKPQRFWRLCRTYGATQFAVVPSHYRALLEFLKEPVESLKSVTVAGERVTSSVVDLHYALFPDVRLVNEYGPAENSVCATFSDLRPDQPVTIGRAAPNTEVALLNDELKPVPDGFPGEICLAGPGLANGYFGDPQRTAAKFVAHPFRDQARLYRTRDVGRLAANGDLEFLWRLDGRVKIAGVTVEPEAVENCLLAHPDVAAAAVVTTAVAQGETELAAFVNGDVEPATLKLYLSRRLRWAEVPRHLLVLDHMPMTRNGKIDRAALQKEILAKAVVGQAAGTPLEADLLEILKTLLGREEIGVDTQFFEAGGDSLMMVRYIGQIKETLDRDAAPGDIFKHPSVQELAAHLTQMPQLSCVDGSLFASPFL